MITQSNDFWLKCIHLQPPMRVIQLTPGFPGAIEPSLEAAGGSISARHPLPAPEHGAPEWQPSLYPELCEEECVGLLQIAGLKTAIWKN